MIPCIRMIFLQLTTRNQRNPNYDKGKYSREQPSFSPSSPSPFSHQGRRGARRFSIPSPIEGEGFRVRAKRLGKKVGCSRVQSCLNTCYRMMLVQSIQEISHKTGTGVVEGRIYENQIPPIACLRTCARILGWKSAVGGLSM